MLDKFGMLKIRFDKKTGMIIAGIMVAVIIFVLLTVPLVNRVRKAGQEIKLLEQEMISTRQVLQFQDKFRKTGELLTRSKISSVIDEITKMGTAKNINFISISPQKIIKPKDSQYPILPIRMSLQSEYEDLGLFLGALERLEKSVIAVKSFQIDADQQILPQIRMDLVIEVYLREGEDG